MDTTERGDTAVEQSGPVGGRHGSGPRVVVGVDGSPGARAALVLALIEAARRGAALDVVTAHPTTLVWTRGAPVDVPDTEAIRAETESRARELVDEVLREESLAGVPGAVAVDVRLVVGEGRAVPLLLEVADGAELLVVGSRGRGAMRSALLGSVALHCVTQAQCPVLVIHPASPPARPARVVVGVDGSAGARTAVAAAVDAAVRAGAELEVVAGYTVTDYWTDLGSVVVPSVEQIRDDLLHRTEDLVEGVLAARPDGSTVPTIRTHVLEGPAGELLVERARDADLLVLGSRGRGAIRGLLLGSVALHCAMHAPGPVMVVHPRPTRDATQEPPAAPAMAGR